MNVSNKFDINVDLLINNKTIYIYHRDWEGTCILDNNKIMRENMNDEFGYYEIIKNKLLIKWDRWNEEEFYYFNNNNIFYFKDIFENNYSTIYILNKNNIFLMLLDKNNNIFVLYNTNTDNIEDLKKNKIVFSSTIVSENSSLSPLRFDKFIVFLKCKRKKILFI